MGRAVRTAAGRDRRRCCAIHVHMDGSDAHHHRPATGGRRCCAIRVGMDGSDAHHRMGGSVRARLARLQLVPPIASALTQVPSGQEGDELTGPSRGEGMPTGGDAARAAYDSGSPPNSSRVGNGPNRCRFDLTPPRRFLYPAILLLLIEEPRHGYRLVDALLALGFGPVDRPGVYRALSDLEHDGLLDSWSATPVAGSTRHVYGVTPAGSEALDRWMRVIATEREALEGVLLRYLKVAPHSVE
jgi:DNA-binding PadR family transcriptional regulator